MWYILKNDFNNYYEVTKDKNKILELYAHECADCIENNISCEDELNGNVLYWTRELERLCIDKDYNYAYQCLNDNHSWLISIHNSTDEVLIEMSKDYYNCARLDNFEKSKAIKDTISTFVLNNY